MTPKEKSDELYNIFDMIRCSDQDEHDQCKRCAIECVDEILSKLNRCESQEDWIYEEEYYWQEVKQEIEKL